MAMANFSLLEVYLADATALNGEFFAIGDLSLWRDCSEWRFFRYWRPISLTCLLWMANFSLLETYLADATALNGEFFAIEGLSRWRGPQNGEFACKIRSPVIGSIALAPFGTLFSYLNYAEFE